jgi:SH3-like domain-containing protein
MPARSIPAGVWKYPVVALLLAVGSPGLGPCEARAASAQFVRVKVDRANLREDPVLSATPLRYAYENEPLRVVGHDGEWLHVQDYEGDSAWIYAPLTDRRPAVVVVRSLVNVRAQPGTDHPVAFTAERGVNLLVLERRGPWLRVEHEVGRGWVHDSLVWGGP